MDGRRRRFGPRPGSVVSRRSARRMTPGWSLRDRETGDQRDREPAGDQREADRGVVGPVADVGLEAAELAAGAPRHLLPRHAGVAGRPRLAGRARRSVASAAVAPGARGGRGRRTARGAARPAGSRSGWCCHSSPSTRSRSPSASAGSACSGSASISSQRSAARARAAPPSPAARAQRDRLEAGDPRPAGDGAGGGGEVGLGARGAFQQRVGVADQHERRIGQPHAAPGLLEQRHAGLALEHRELLRDGRGVNWSASATAAIVPRSCSSLSRRRRRSSSM